MTLGAPVTQDEVLSCWVRAETSSTRFGPALTQARAACPQASNAELLAATRGWPDRGYFHDFPSDIRWFRAQLTPAELSAVKYINWDYWLDVSAGTRLPSVAAKRMGWTDGLPSPDGVEPLILVTDTTSAAIVVLEGHSRLTGYVIAGAQLTDPVDCYLGVSERIEHWGCF